MDRADELIEVMAKAVREARNPYITPPTNGTAYDEFISRAVLSAIEAAGYVVGKIEFCEKSGVVSIGKIGVGYITWSKKGFAPEIKGRILGNFPTVSEARAAAEAAVRKAMIGE